MAVLISIFFLQKFEAVAARTRKHGNNSGAQAVGVNSFNYIVEVIPIIVLGCIIRVIARSDGGGERVIVVERLLAKNICASCTPDALFAHDRSELNNGKALLFARR